MKPAFSFGTTVESSFDEAVARVTEELRKEGFGVLTDIDVRATMRKKLDLEVAPYRILGACNPQLAYRALSFEPRIGVLLPCNVVVRQDETGVVHVDFMDPRSVLDLIDRPEVTELAMDVRQRLERVRDALH